MALFLLRFLEGQGRHTPLLPVTAPASVAAPTSVAACPVTPIGRSAIAERSPPSSGDRVLHVVEAGFRRPEIVTVR